MDYINNNCFEERLIRELLEENNIEVSTDNVHKMYSLHLSDYMDRPIKDLFNQNKYIYTDWYQKHQYDIEVKEKIKHIIQQYEYLEQMINSYNDYDDADNMELTFKCDQAITDMIEAESIICVNEDNRLSKSKELLKEMYGLFSTGLVKGKHNSILRKNNFSENWEEYISFDDIWFEVNYEKDSWKGISSYRTMIYVDLKLGKSLEESDGSSEKQDYIRKNLFKIGEFNENSIDIKDKDFMKIVVKIIHQVISEYKSVIEIKAVEKAAENREKNIGYNKKEEIKYIKLSEIKKRIKKSSKETK
jgi:hypothetical protein